MSSKLKEGKDKPLVPISDDEARLSVALPPATYDELVIFAKQYGLKKAKVQLEKGQDPTQVEINFRIFPKSINIRNEMDEETAEMQDEAEVVKEIMIENQVMQEMTAQQYIVQPGDTLFFIAKRFNVPLDALKTANPQITNPDLIFPGQIVMIPTQNLLPVPPNVFKYIVQAGDTLFFVARRFNVSLETLRLANPQITNPGLIFPGQIVFVPMTQMPPMQPGVRQYIIQLGDTVEAIARRFGVTVDGMLRINPQITNKDLIFPGQMIFVPSTMDGQRCDHDDHKDKHHHKEKHHKKEKHYDDNEKHHKDKHHGDDEDDYKDNYHNYNLKSNDEYGCEEEYSEDKHYSYKKQEEKHEDKYEKKPEEKHEDKYGKKHEEECDDDVKEHEKKKDKCEKDEHKEPEYKKEVEKCEKQEEEHHKEEEHKENKPKEKDYDQDEECKESKHDTYPKKEECKPEPPKEECYKLEECETLNYFMYVVQPNDTLFEIAKKLCVDLKELEEANPCIASPEKIYPGQIIKIPTKKYKKPLRTMKYVVQKGDTLVTVAGKFDISLAILSAANPWVTDHNVLFAGQIIYIPVSKMPPVDMNYFKYIAQAGDTLQVISQKFGIRLESMIKVNPWITNPNSIVPGQIVLIPTNKTMYKPAGTTEYVVHSGDTLFFVARRFGFMLADLISANPQIKNPDLILPGQVINIPPCEMKHECMENVPPKG